MNCDYLMVHYGELSTKGNNRKEFISCLTGNVRHALKGLECKVEGKRDHIYVRLPNPTVEEEAISRLLSVSGIQRISPVYKCSRDEGELAACGASLIRDSMKSTFKVETKRSDKTYPLDSYAICRLIASAALKTDSRLSVDVHNPEVTLRCNLREDAAYLSLSSYPGLGGYPLGMNGKVTLLLSGGIDSPVAAYSLLRRGIKIEGLHFASPPYTSMAVIDKLKDILSVLNGFQSDIRLDVVPFTKIQEAIYEHVPEPYCITIMRRMMMRLAESWARKRKCLAIATGESIGQVASQTLESLQVINEVTNYPILRPLCVSDKVEVIETAKRIGTFDISIRPFEDCCTIFKPKKPKTHPNIEHVRRYESFFDFLPLLEEALSGINTIYMSDGEEVIPSK